MHEWKERDKVRIVRKAKSFDGWHDSWMTECKTNKFNHQRDTHLK